jgi:phosphoenolpyruvate carboxykinase (GTP)
LSMTDHTDESKLPRIYGVNWFRKDADGNFVWPGYSENSRVLEWICRRLEGEAGATDTPIGAVPSPADLNLEGFDASPDRVAAALEVDLDAWRRELPTMHEHFDKFGEHLPAELRAELEALEQRLG